MSLLALYDTRASGLIPCKIMGIHTRLDYPNHLNVTIQITAGRGSYARGELLTVGNGTIWQRPARTVRGTYGMRRYGKGFERADYEAAGLIVEEVI